MTAEWDSFSGVRYKSLAVECSIQFYLKVSLEKLTLDIYQIRVDVYRYVEHSKSGVERNA